MKGVLHLKQIQSPDSSFLPWLASPSLGSAASYEFSHDAIRLSTFSQIGDDVAPWVPLLPARLNIVHIFGIQGWFLWGQSWLYQIEDLLLNWWRYWSCQGRPHLRDLVLVLMRSVVTLSDWVPCPKLMKMLHPGSPCFSLVTTSPSSTSSACTAGSREFQYRYLGLRLPIFCPKHEKRFSVTVFPPFLRSDRSYCNGWGSSWYGSCWPQEGRCICIIGISGTWGRFGHVVCPK